MLFPNFIWSLPAKIINSSANSEGRGGGCRKSARRRPLHTCGASCVAIARKACTKAQDLDGPLGSSAKTCITFVNSFFPIVHIMVHRCLGLLLIIDDHILSMEKRIEGIFPRSSILFDCVDELTRCAEGLPENLDDMSRKVLHMIHHYFPLLEWGVGLILSCLNYLVSMVFKNARAREKEITIDENYCKEKMSSTEHTKMVQFEKPYSYADAARNNGGEEKTKAAAPNTEVVHLSVKRLHSWKSRIKALEEPLTAGDSPMYSSYQSANTSPVSDSVSDCSQEENQTFNQVGCTYKEILERPEKKDEEEEEHEEEEEEEDQEDQVVHVHRDNQVLYSN